MKNGVKMNGFFQRKTVSQEINRGIDSDKR